MTTIRDLNTKSDGDCGYVAVFKGKGYGVYAQTLSDAKDKAVALLKARKRHDVDVYLAETDDGSLYVHTMT
jgi:hypothetical protein